jgi:hypothetical protein
MTGINLSVIGFDKRFMLKQLFKRKTLRFPRTVSLQKRQLNIAKGSQRRKVLS